MSTAPLYPLFLSLQGEHCLVAGFGSVGTRKLQGLLACKVASVLVLDSRPAASMGAEQQALLQRTGVHFENRPCTVEDVARAVLVFAATGDAAENRRITELCRSTGTLCNCVTDPEEGHFQVPATARCAGLAAALSTGGASPALARRWRQELQEWLQPRAAMVCFMARLRPLVLALHNETGQNTTIFRTLAASPLQEWLAAGELEQCRAYLLEVLPSALHGHIAELLHDLH